MLNAASIAAALLALNAQFAAPIQTTSTMPAAPTIEEYVRAEFSDAPVMIEIASCESEFTQFDKAGNVLMNHGGSSATGVFQIMASIHAKPALKMGMDINTIEGNILYARYLYETQGTKPWQADLKSKKCWGKTQVGQAQLALNK